MTEQTDGRTDGHSVVCLRKRTKWLHTLLLSSTLSAKDVVAYTVRNVLLVMDAHWNSVLHVQLHLVGTLANGAWLRCTTVSVCMRLRVCTVWFTFLNFTQIFLFCFFSPSLSACHRHPLSVPSDCVGCFFNGTFLFVFFLFLSFVRWTYKYVHPSYLSRI